MTTFSHLVADVGNSPKKSDREGAIIDTIVWHHMAATDGPAETAMMRGAGGREVSANYTIHSDGSIHGVVPEEYRAWTSGYAYDGGKGAAWDRRAITIEIENDHVGPRDEDYTISDAALDAAAQLSLDIRSRYTIAHEMGHRDENALYGASYPTYCPGPNTVAEIQRRAGHPAATNPEEEFDMTATEDVAWLKARTGGSTKGEQDTLTDLLRKVLANQASQKAQLDALQKDVDYITDRQLGKGTREETLRQQVDAIEKAVAAHTGPTGEKKA